MSDKTPFQQGVDNSSKALKGLMKEVFGDRVSEIPVSSLKPMTGHVIGAGTAIEFMGGVLGIKYKFIPPTINLDDPINGENGLRLDHVVNEARTGVYLRNILKFSMGFGGHNAALTFGEYVNEI